jgi:hypothetical protein
MMLNAKCTEKKRQAGGKLWMSVMRLCSFKRHNQCAKQYLYSAPGIGAPALWRSASCTDPMVYR